MKNKLKSVSIRFAFAAAAGLAVSAVSSHAQSVEATISGVAVSGGYDYTISLENTGTQDLNTLWYGWSFAYDNNLPSEPSDFGNSLGWAGSLDGSGSPYSIIWQNNSGTALLAGQTGTFTFFSSDSPADITAFPSGGSDAFTGVGIFSGSSTPDFYPTLETSPTPEPGFSALMAAGASSLLLLNRKKISVPQRKPARY